jgi:hypothetical protein
MGSDEERTVRDLKAHQASVLPMIGDFGGRIIDTAGDGILAEFGSAVKAVECAVAIQNKMTERNAKVEPERRMRFRIGINIGDVIYDEARIYGDGLNIAARLESIAEPGGIFISRQAYDQVDGKLALSFRKLGPQTLKNILKQVEVFAAERRLRLGMPTPARRRWRKRRPRRRRRRARPRAGSWPQRCCLCCCFLAAEATCICGRLIRCDLPRRRCHRRPPRSFRQRPPRQRSRPLPSPRPARVRPTRGVSTEHGLSTLPAPTHRVRWVTASVSPPT